MNEFEQLGVGAEICRAIQELGFEKPTPIQEQAIPVLVSGDRDFVGLAQTGTGKTAAFGLPLAQLVDFNSRKTQALILAPTRELCVQIANDLVKYTKYSDSASIVAVYGGASIQTQLSQIKRGVQIVVATPGRLLDIIGRKSVDLSSVNYVVLDEADEMLNMGFQEDITDILSNTPSTKQTWLFSATMPQEVRRIAERFMKNPFELTVGKKNTGAENIQHVYYMVHARDKYAALKRIVDFNADIFGIVFCRTKLETQDVAERLVKDGYNADALHGDLSQQQRDKVMKRYRDKSLQVLVATDVAARGIDVQNITHVINYNLPDDIESYTHRSGRTARAGKSGISIAIINMKEVGKIRQIERQINQKFTPGKIPSGAEVCEKQLLGLMHRIHEVNVDEKEISAFLPAIYKELEDLSKEDLIKRFASMEFNRFLTYYKNAPDLNVDGSGARGERDSMRRAASDSDRLFISLGKMDDIDPGQLLRFIATTSGVDGSRIGKIDLKGVYSFFDIDKDVADEVMNALNGKQYQGRPVRVEKAGPATGESSRSRGSYEGGDRRKSYGSGDGGERRKSYGDGGERRKSYGSGDSGERRKSYGDSGNGSERRSSSSEGGERRSSSSDGGDKRPPRRRTDDKKPGGGGRKPSGGGGYRKEYKD